MDHWIAKAGRFGRIVWASPASLAGLAGAALAALGGGRVRLVDGVLEAHGGIAGRLMRRGLPVIGSAAAVTLGHVVLGADCLALEVTRGHERVHVRQYERWGPFFIPAYLLASLIQWIMGHHPYLDNPFERQAYREDRDRQAGDGGPAGEALTGATRSDIMIHLRLTMMDGRTAEYTQTDRAKSEFLLELLDPGRVLSHSPIILAGPSSISLIPTDKVARIDVFTDRELDWPFHYNLRNLILLTEEEFRERYEPSRRGAKHRPGELVSAFCEVELVTGERLFLDVTVRAEERTPLDVHSLFEQLLSAHALHARRPEGGATIINPKAVVRITMYPGPPETPHDAWPVTPLQE